MIRSRQGLRLHPRSTYRKPPESSTRKLTFLALAAASPRGGARQRPPCQGWQGPIGLRTHGTKPNLPGHPRPSSSCRMPQTRAHHAEGRGAPERPVLARRPSSCTTGPQQRRSADQGRQQLQERSHFVTRLACLRVFFMAVRGQISIIANTRSASSCGRLSDRSRPSPGLIPSRHALWS